MYTQPIQPTPYTINIHDIATKTIFSRHFLLHLQMHTYTHTPIKFKCFEHIASLIHRVHGAMYGFGNVINERINRESNRTKEKKTLKSKTQCKADGCNFVRSIQKLQFANTFFSLLNGQSTNRPTNIMHI